MEQGYALPYLPYGDGVYRDAEAKAKVARASLHAGTFQNPWDYRWNSASLPTAGAPRLAAPHGVAYPNCTAASAAGAAPVRAGQPDYGRHWDGDGDEVSCQQCSNNTS